LIHYPECVCISTRFIDSEAPKFKINWCLKISAKAGLESQRKKRNLFVSHRQIQTLHRRKRNELADRLTSLRSRVQDRRILKPGKGANVKDQTCLSFHFETFPLAMLSDLRFSVACFCVDLWLNHVFPIFVPSCFRGGAFLCFLSHVQAA